MPASDAVRVLVLGGTAFVGRAVVADALARGWDVTVLNRGSMPAPDGVRQLVGDRTQPDGLDALAEGDWDVVVDTWSWAPRAVRDAAGLLADRVSSYVYVSSRSVYRWPVPAGANEQAPTVEGDSDAGDGEYAANKAGAEQAVVDSIGARGILARAGLVLGPWEDVGRLPWWLTRVARGGRVLAPGPAELPLQFVDARDLAAFCLDAGVRGLGGPFDVVSAPRHTTMGELLAAGVEVTGADADLVWATPEQVIDAGIEPWTDLPIWMPPGESHDAIHRGDTSRARAAGLTCRPAVETVADTWEWLTAIGGNASQRPDRPPVGLDTEREQALLATLS